MREVPSILLGFMCEMFHEAGLDSRPALEGLHLAEITPRLGVRVDWDELATFLNRASAGLSDDEMERLGEGYVRSNRYLSVLLGLVTRPRVVYRMGWVASRQAFPHMSFAVEDIDANTLSLRMTLPRSFVGSYFFFRATGGELRALPRLLDLPDADVEVEASSHHAVYRVCLEEPARLWTRLVRGRDEVKELLAEDLLSVMSSFRSGPRVTGRSLRRLQEQHALTYAEARVAARLAEGMKVADIADDLHVSVETVRTHLKRTYQKTGVRRQAELVGLVLGDAGVRDEP